MRWYIYLIIGILIIGAGTIYFVNQKSLTNTSNINPQTSSGIKSNSEITSKSSNEISFNPYVTYETGNYIVTITGNESKWVDSVSVVRGEVIVKAKEEKDRTYDECIEWDTKNLDIMGQPKCLKTGKVIYDIPIDLKAKDSLGLQIGTASKTTDISSATIFKYNITQATSSYLKLGDNSIVIIPETTGYSTSVNTNVTSETGKTNFSHLNVSDNSLIAYYPFDVEPTNSLGQTFYDLTKSNNDATGVGYANSSSTCGIIGNGICLNGTANTYVSTPVNAQVDGLASATWSFWIKMNKLPANNDYVHPIEKSDTTRGTIRTIIADSNNGVFKFQTAVTTSNNGWYTAGAYVIGTTTINTGTWYFVTSRYNGTGVQIFVNGVLEGSTTGISGTLYPTNPEVVTFGKKLAAVAQSEWLNASMDDIQIFNKSLTNAEILNLYAQNYSKFNPTGTQDFQNKNLTNGSNLENAVNITLSNCLTLNSTNLSGTIGVNNGAGYTYNGTIVNFTNCVANNVSIPGNPSNTSLRITQYSNQFNSYTSDVIGNITLSSYVSGGGADTTYPQFTATAVNISNNSVYGFGKAYKINVTTLNTNGTAIITLDGVNFSMINDSISNYNYNVPSLSAGKHTYLFYSWGNGTSHNINISASYDYYVAKDTPILTITQDPPSPVTYPTSTNTEAFGCPAQLTCEFWRNTTNLGAGITQNELILGVGVYNYTYNTTGNQNYTSALNYSYVVVNANTGYCGVFFNTTSPLTYNSLFIVYTNCSTAYTIYRNGTSISNASTQNLGAGYYNFTVIRTDKTNYSNYTETRYFTINQATPSLGITGTTPITYGTISDFAGTNCPSGLTCTLNWTNQIFGVGSWVFNYSTAGNTNYTSNWTIKTLVVNQRTGISNLTTTPVTPITYTANSNFSCSNPDGLTSILYLNGTNINTLNNLNNIYGAGTYNVSCITTGNTNISSSINSTEYQINKNTTALSITGTSPIIYNATSDFVGVNCPTGLSCNLNATNQVYGNGTYTFNYSFAGNSNYTFNWTIKNLLVNRNESLCALFFNETSPIDEGQLFTVYSNCSSTFQIYRNGTAVNNNSVQNLAAGYYNFTVIRDDMSNYSNFTWTKFMTIISGTDVSTCRVLSTPNTIYTQIGNIIPAVSPCINITAPNVTFNGNGLWIANALGGIGIYSNQFNSTILNTNVSLGSGGIGLELIANTNSNISNNIFNSNSIAIYLFNSSFGYFKNITAYSSLSDAIQLINASNNNTFNNIRVASSGGSGFTIDNVAPRSTNNTFINSNASYNTQDGFSLSYSQANTTLINNTASNNGRYGLYLTGSGNLIVNNTFNLNANAIVVQGLDSSIFINNTLTNCLATSSSSGCFLSAGMINTNMIGGIINNSATNGLSLTGANSNNNFTDFSIGYSALNDTYLSGTAGSINNIFLNVTYLLSKEYVNIDSQLIRKWYYRAYVNDTYGNPLQDAYINATNVLGVSVYNSTTSSLGYSTNFNITDYFNNGTRVYSSNYTINASKPLYYPISRGFNASLGNDLLDYYTLQNASLCSVIVNETSPATYPVAIKVYSNCLTSFKLYQNGTLITNNSQLNLSAGTYNFTVIRDDLINYHYVYDEVTFQINKGTLTGTITSTKGFNYMFDDSATTIGFTESNTGDSDITYNIYRDGVYVDSETANLQVGTYNYTLNSTGGQNYSAGLIQTRLLIVSINSATIISIIGSNVTYPNNLSIEGINCPAQLTCNLYQNGSLVSNPETNTFLIGTYNYTYNATGNINYTNKQVYKIFNISKGNPPLTLTSTGGWNMPAASFTTILGDNCPAQITCNLFLNYVAAPSNPYSQLFGSGSYYFNYNTTGNENYTAWDINNILNIAVNPININQTQISICRWKKFGIYNESLPYFREVQCL